MFVLEHRFSLQHAADFAINYFENRLTEVNGDVHKLNLLLFTELGTSSGVMQFFDAIDNSVFFRLTLFLKKSLPRWISQPGRMARVTKMWLGVVVAAAFYYADIAKDVLIAVQFSSKILGTTGITMDVLRNNTYPFIILVVIVGSIAVTEVLNLLTTSMMNFSTSKFVEAIVKLLAILSTPFVPGILLHRIKRTELESWEQATSSKVQHHVLNRLTGRLHRIRQVHATLRSNENVAEHLVQLCLFTIVLLAEESGTRTVQTVGNILIEENRNFVYLSTLLALSSITRGHMNLIDAIKKGYLPFIGKIILVPYFLLSTIARVGAVVVFFTPLLGLFNVLSTSQLGALSFSDDVVYDILSNGTTVPLQKEWAKFQIAELTDVLPRHMFYVYLGVSAAVFCIHSRLGTVIWKMVLKQDQLWPVLYTAITPPLFADWEEICRFNEYKISIRKCWMMYLKGFTCFVGLFALEHIALCIPIAILKYVLMARAASMEAMYFPALPEEQMSLAIVDGLLFSAIGIYCLLLPLTQFALALLYFKYGHAWSRVLNRECKAFAGDVIPTADNIREDLADIEEPEPSGTNEDIANHRGSDISNKMLRKAKYLTYPPKSKAKL